MTIKDVLLDMERQFWLRGADYFAHHITDDCLMVFPKPTGVMQREVIMNSVGQGARWESLEISEENLTQPGKGVALLTYRAKARKKDRSYDTLAGSLYVDLNGAWKLAFHQQTPIA